MFAESAAPPRADRRPKRPPRNAPMSEFRVEPLKAFAAFRRLVENKEDTAQVFEIVRALSGRSLPNGYRQLLNDEEGARQAYLRAELRELLDDKEWLARFPEGTVGAAFRAFLAPRGLTAEGLADESRKLDDTRVDAQHPVSWYARRLRDVHDVWHVLTGYGTDTLGEACVLAFTYAQTGNRGLAFIVLGAAREMGKRRLGQPYARAMWEAFQRGREAEWLSAVDYEALFAQPLNAARARLEIGPAPVYESVPRDRRDAGFAAPPATTH